TLISVQARGDRAIPRAACTSGRGTRQDRDVTFPKGEVWIIMDTPSLPPARIRLIFAGLALALLLAALDQTVVATALPTIATDLGGLGHIAWVVSAYLSGVAVAMPLSGKLGDVYGRKIVFLVAVVIFLVGSALCGLAQSLDQLIVFRALQGVGGGSLI